MCGGNAIAECDELRRRLWPQKNKPRTRRLFARFPEVLELDDEDFEEFEADFQAFEADCRDSDFDFGAEDDSDDEVVEITPPSVKPSISRGITFASLGVV
jgi:hypothetical protein